MTNKIVETVTDKSAKLDPGIVGLGLYLCAIAFLIGVIYQRKYNADA